MVSRCHNCIQFKFEKAGRIPPSEVFGRTVLLLVLEFKAEDFYCLISLAHGFDVCFHSAGSLADEAVTALSDH